MATDVLPPTLSFLTDAAHLLHAASPEVSAHLMSQRNALMFTNDLVQSDVQRQHVCGCCGHIMVAGQGDALKIEAIKAVKTAKRRKGPRNGEKAKVPPRKGCQKQMTCGNCGHYTKISLPSPPQISSRKHLRQGSKPQISGDNAGKGRVASSLPEVTATLGAEASNKSSANASSKKRAKNRKQGLQALLQQSANSKPQSGLGLSLSDFMKN
ncbi:hypothetical protein GGR57DRAFT_425280 [Xylariaceae sp. FL1272]|nr:hypothetical protein GGR57DRAFT_425280 [Xylariaceae sp. FL1272]